MAIKDSYTLIQQMAANAEEAQMMKDPDFRADRQKAEQQEAQLVQPTSWEQASQGLERLPEPQTSQELER